MNEQELLHDLVNNEGWKHAKRKLLERVLETNDLSSVKLDAKAPTSMIMELKVNQRVANTILEWIKEVENNAAAHVLNKSLVQEMKEDIIQQF